MSGGFSGEKQVIKFAYVRKRGRVCLFYPTEIDNGKLQLEVITVTFLDEVATAHVLTASNNDVKLIETRPVHFAWL